MSKIPAGSGMAGAPLVAGPAGAVAATVTLGATGRAVDARRIAGAEVTVRSLATLAEVWLAALGSTSGAAPAEESLLVCASTDAWEPVGLSERAFEVEPDADDRPEAAWPPFFDPPDAESGDEPADAPDESVGSACATPAFAATATPKPTATASPPTRDTYFTESIGCFPFSCPLLTRFAFTRARSASTTARISVQTVHSPTRVTASSTTRFARTTSSSDRRSTPLKKTARY